MIRHRLPPFGPDPFLARDGFRYVIVRSLVAFFREPPGLVGFVEQATDISQPLFRICRERGR